MLLKSALDAIAVDGVVVSGSTYIDESMVTGESVPVKETGTKWWEVRSTQRRNSSFELADGADTTLAKIVVFVESSPGFEVAHSRHC